MMCCALQSAAQSIPTEGEHIDFLMTFGNRAEKTWGDDDHVQSLVELTVAAAVESVADRLAGRGGDRGDAGESGERCSLVTRPLWDQESTT